MRRLFACLLLVLLPFQAMAVSLGAMEKQAGPCAQMMMADMDCCDSDGGDGCAPASCLGVTATVAAVLPVAAAPLAGQGQPCARPGGPPHYPASFIPDSPQRPPQAHS